MSLPLAPSQASAVTAASFVKLLAAVSPSPQLKPSTQAMSENSKDGDERATPVAATNNITAASVVQQLLSDAAAAAAALRSCSTAGTSTTQQLATAAAVARALSSSKSSRKTESPHCSTSQIQPDMEKVRFCSPHSLFSLGMAYFLH